MTQLSIKRPVWAYRQTPNLSPEHEASLAHLLKHAKVKIKSKGAVYLSPLKDSPKKRELLPRFYKIKEESRLPVFVYLIQRL